ncbi:unnamed protein product [Discula destructiva]
MAPHELSHLGDEPLYCNTDHDEVLYSGDDDDYYEAPEHRRMRIEAKAVQFLNGHVPYLLSARLRGPFDAKSWTNPWRSKRMHRQAAARPASQSCSSVGTVEVGRPLGSGKTRDDPPNTQRTSLFPLPSPDITNPPSARKNPYMAEEEFNRIRTWRETVKKVPLSKDPFWTSSQGQTQHSTGTRKRSGDQNWLHKREAKKRKSEDLRKLPQNDSPSHAAAKHRGNQLSGPLTEIVTQSAPGSSTHEDELAAHWGPKTASFNISRTTNIPTNTPRILPKVHKTQSLHSSDDELSIPSPAPRRAAVRSPSKDAFASSSRGRSSQQKNSAVIDTRFWDTHVRANKAQNMATSHGPVEKTAKGLAKNPAKTTLGVSQQDNSFYFHQARPRYRSSPKEPLSADKINGMALRLPPSQNVASVTIRTLSQECSGDHEATHGAQAVANPNDQLDVDPNVTHEAPPETRVEAQILHENGKMTKSTSLSRTQAAGHPPMTEICTMNTIGQQEDVGEPRQSQHERLVICTDAGPALSKHSCTQELSPVSMQDRPQAALESATISRKSSSTNSPEIDLANASKPEWSTYVNTQDLSTDAHRPSAIIEAIKDAEPTTQNTIDPDDPDWTTYVYTQDSATPENENGIQVVAQGPGDASDPEWSTFLNTQDLSTAQVEFEVPSTARSEHTLEQEHELAKSAKKIASGSDSKWSSSMGASSGDDAENTENTSNEIVPANASDVESKFSQDTVGAIIAGYVDHEQSLNGLESCAESRVLIAHPCERMAVIQHLEVDEVLGSDGRREQDTNTLTVSSQSNFALASVTAMEPNNSPLGLAEEPEPVFDGSTTMGLESHNLPAQEVLVQSPWAKGEVDLPVSLVPSKNTAVIKSTSQLNLLAGQTRACSHGPQTPWVGDRLPSPNFSLSVKRFSDFMKPSPRKKRVSVNSSIRRSSDSTTRVLFGTPVPVKPNRHVIFAPLPGEELGFATSESKSEANTVEEDLSYFDAKGKKKAFIRITRSHTRAASPPPSNVNIADANELPDHDKKFARHFEAMSKRRQDLPRKVQRLLPSESQQTNSSQAVDAMAEAFIQASQTREQSFEVAEGIDDDSRSSQTGPKKAVCTAPTDLSEERENIEPVDDVSAVLDNIDEFLDNSWGFNTSMDVENDYKKGALAERQTNTVPSRFAGVEDPMLALHANAWAD